MARLLEFLSQRMRNLTLQEILNGRNGFIEISFPVSSAEPVLFPISHTSQRLQPMCSTVDYEPTLYHILTSFIYLQNHSTTISGIEGVIGEGRSLYLRRSEAFRSSSRATKMRTFSFATILGQIREVQDIQRRVHRRRRKNGGPRHVEPRMGFQTTKKN